MDIDNFCVLILVIVLLGSMFDDGDGGNGPMGCRGRRF